jgi:ComF family protein
MNNSINRSDLQPKFIKQTNFLIDFILPRLCLSCKQKLSSKEYVICSKCFSELTIIDENYIASEYERKFLKDNLISDIKPAFVFKEGNVIQNLIHSLKYEQKYLAGIFLGRLIAKIWFEEIQKWNADLIIPVPLHRLKKLERGYNQSYYIVKGLEKELKIPINNRLLKRIRQTESQTFFNHFKRKENVKNAFCLTRKHGCRGKTIILVDDVITTGSTVSECASVLKKAGALKIYGLFAAIAQFNLD